MEKFILIWAVILISAAYGRSSTVLVIHPDGYFYKKIDEELGKKVKNDVIIRSFIPQSDAEVRDAFKKNTAQLTVVVNQGIISLWKDLHNEYQYKVSPSIFIGSELDDHLITNNLPNNSIILYRVKLDQYVNNAYNLTGIKPERIGVIYSYKGIKLVQALKNDCTHLNVELFPYAVAVANSTASIKEIFSKMVIKNNVDLLIVPDDPLVMNSENIKSVWAEQLSTIAIPVAIPPQYLASIPINKNIFSLLQDHNRIVAYISELISNAQANNWNIPRRKIQACSAIRLIQKKQKDENSKNVAEKFPSMQPVNDSRTSIGSIKETSEIVVSAKAVTNKNIEIQRASFVVASDLWSNEPINKNQKFDNGKELVSSKNMTSSENRISSDAGSQKHTASVKVLSDGSEKNQHTVRNKNEHVRATSETNNSSYGNITKIIYRLEISSKAVPVYSGLSPETSVFSIARTGDTLDVFAEDSTWLYINVSGVAGFILKSDIEYNQNSLSHLFDDNIILFVWLSASLSVIFIVAVIIVLQRSRKKQSETSDSHVNPSSIESYFEGTLNKEMIPEILTLIDTNKKTGCLVVKSQDTSGVMYFEDGVITHAKFGSLTNEDAAFSILSLTSGTFRFISNKIPQTKMIYIEVQAILLENARIEDETSLFTRNAILKQYPIETNSFSNNSIAGEVGYV